MFNGFPTLFKDFPHFASKFCIFQLSSNIFDGCSDVVPCFLTVLNEILALRETRHRRLLLYLKHMRIQSTENSGQE